MTDQPTTLEEKLIKLLRYGVAPFPEQFVRSEGDVIEQIEQAFIDAGWQRSFPRISGYGVAEAGAKKIIPLMTGQEWYYRFEKELKTTWNLHSYGRERDEPEYLDDFSVDEFRDAAKRAAGLENNS